MLAMWLSQLMAGASETPGRKVLGVRVTPVLITQLKVVSAILGKTQTEVVEEALLSLFDRHQRKILKFTASCHTNGVQENKP